MVSIYMVLAVLGGMLVPFQAGVNMALAVRVGSPVWAAFVSFAVGMVALVLYALRLPFPDWSRVISEAPWYLWVGGLCGAYLVWMSIFAAPKIGAAVLIACLVGGQMLSSIVFDHYGWLGYEARPINTGRILGAGLIMAGAFLVRKF
ncbi:MAG: DMT family transporter [Nitrospina sp.]|nr:DMT family transporter [Nitrospina sp.]